MLIQVLKEILLLVEVEENTQKLKNTTLEYISILKSENIIEFGLLSLPEGKSTDKKIVELSGFVSELSQELLLNGEMENIRPYVDYFNILHGT